VTITENVTHDKDQTYNTRQTPAIRRIQDM